MGVLQKVTMEKAYWDGIMESLKEDEPNYDQPTLCMVTFGQSQLSHLFLLFIDLFFIISTYFDIQV